MPDAQIQPGASVVLVCKHGVEQGRGIVIRRLEFPCDCGGTLWRLRVTEGGARGQLIDVCGQALELEPS